MDSRDQERVTFGQVLSRRDFFRVWSAHTVSLLGDRLTQVAIMIYVLELSGGSAALVSLSLAAPLLPYVLLGPFAGVLVERWDKRKVMVVCDLARAAIVCSVPFFDKPWPVLAAAFLMGCFSTCFSPAQLSAIPELLESKREILVAQSLMSSTRYLTDLLGFTAASGVVMAMGCRPAFLIDALTFVVSASFLVRVTKRLVVDGPREVSLAAFRDELVGGIRYHRDNPVVLSQLVSFTVGVLGIAGLNPLLLIAIPRLMGAAPSIYGFLLATQSVTMLLTSTAIGHFGQKVPKPAFVVLGFFGLGLCALGFAFNRSVPVAFLLYALLGLANATFVVPSWSWVQESVPFEFRARVVSLRNTMANLAGMLSYFAAGPLADRFGVGPVACLIGVATCLAAVSSIPLPGFREAFFPSRRKGAAAA